jgi:hypothetical protein
MLIRRWGLCGGAVAVSIGCRTPTQMTVELWTDVPCVSSPTTTLWIGKSDTDLDDHAPIMRTTNCKSNGRIGSIVLVPSGAPDEAFALKVVLAHGARSVESCEKADSAPEPLAGCIVARRDLKFVPHSELVLPIELHEDCDGVRCAASESCVHGKCVLPILGARRLCNGAACQSPLSPPLEPRDSGHEFDASVDGKVDGHSDADADRDATIDAPASEGGPLDPAEERARWDKWLSFLTLREARYATRRIDCLNEPVGIIQDRLREKPSPDLRLSLRLRLVELDDQAMAACLGALEGASCEDIVKFAEYNADHVPRSFGMTPFESCDHVIVGQVAKGRACLFSTDCDSSEPMVCAGGNSCSGFCVSRPAAASIGEPCDDRPCVPGAVCRNDPLPTGPLMCAAGGQGAPCSDPSHCAPGFFCPLPSPAQSPTTCHPVKIGAPCQGSWDCPRTLACVGANAGTPGSCVAGSGMYAPCQVQATIDPYIFTDCARFVQCIDSDGLGPRCFAGNFISQRCGAFQTDAGTDLSLGCIDGWCDIQVGAIGLCAQQRPAWATCATDETCAPPNQCLFYRQEMLLCVPPPVEHAVGELCHGPYEEQECVGGAYCRPAPTPSDQLAGICQAYRRDGEPCSETNRCDRLTVCVLGVCTKCSPLP